MGVSTDGIIAFGVMCEEGTEFPWDDFDDVSEWWLTTSGYVPTLHPFTKLGEYAEGWTEQDSRLDIYFAERRGWEKEHPIPVEVVNYCSHNAPMFAICIPGTLICCTRGYPKAFDVEALRVTEEEVGSLLAFLDEYNIESDRNPQWLLMSFWG